MRYEENQSAEKIYDGHCGIGSAYFQFWRRILLLENSLPAGGYDLGKIPSGSACIEDRTDRHAIGIR